MALRELLADPGLRALYLPGIATGVCTALLCGVLSPLVVVKRLGFIGQGISHSAFGGVGVAAVLAAWGLIAPAGLAEFAVVLAFCALAALGMMSPGWGLRWLRPRGAGSDNGMGRADEAATSRVGSGAPRAESSDTAIGVYLVGSMALGAALVHIAREHAVEVGRAAETRPWEAILFGSVLLAGWREALLSLATLILVTLACTFLRRKLLLWAVDDEGAAAAGLRVEAIRAALGLLLAIVVVATMKVAGVVLASALLVLPGAAALRLSDRLAGAAGVVSLSCIAAAGSMLVGLALAFETSLPPGPCVVGVMLLTMTGARVIGVR